MSRQNDILLAKVEITLRVTLMLTVGAMQKMQVIARRIESFFPKIKSNNRRKRY